MGFYFQQSAEISTTHTLTDRDRLTGTPLAPATCTLNCEAGETAQSVSANHKDQSLIPRTYVKTRVQWHEIVSPVLGGSGNVSLELTDQLALLNW